MSHILIREIFKTIIIYLIPIGSMIFLIIYSAFLTEKLTIVETKMSDLQAQSQEWNRTSGNLESEMNLLRDDLKAAEALHLSDSDRMVTGLLRIQDIYFDLLHKNDGMDLVWSDPNTGKIAYLSFDDGPSENTLNVLEILAKEKIQASFFVNGHPNFASTYKLINQKGHLLGNHGYSHDYNQIYKSVDAFTEDQEKLEILVKNAGAKLSKIYRFPGGAKNTFAIKIAGPDLTARISQAMATRGYYFYEWNVIGDDTEIKKDHSLATSAEIAKRVLDLATGKRIALILLHDGTGHASSVAALPEIIAGLRKQGFSFHLLPIGKENASSLK